jgi:hypothetical protein
MQSISDVAFVDVRSYRQFFFGLAPIAGRGVRLRGRSVKLGGQR